MNIRKHIPNFITSLNLFAGSLAVFFAFQGKYDLTLWAILIAGLFDFMDGFAARLLNAYSPMGKELDSLADVISFGLAPGALAYSMLEASQWPYWVSFAGFIIPVFSALRLAKFNIDESQSSSFRGLPTPSNAIFWAGLSYSFSGFMIQNPTITLLSIFVLSYLLVSQIPMFALKFSSAGWVNNKMQYLFLTGSIALLILLGWGAFAPIIAWYILGSIAVYPLLKK